jgi:mannosyltransferase OCH1-like enzyme
MKKIRYRNCALSDAEKNLGNKKIIFFGAGSWLEMVDKTALMKLKNQFAYVIDNKPGGHKLLGDRELKVYSPLKLKEESEAIVIITSTVHMYEMYHQLEDMDLSDGIECYSLPFMQLISNVDMDSELVKAATDIRRTAVIPKTIHCFWFSGEKKPYAYQKCVDTWQEKLKGYEIIEWNKDNYDWHKHPFIERAIELEAWAFAADFARLDVLKEYGGIYLDMDIEVFKPFDDLLGNDAILSFGSNLYIDLAILGAKKNHPLVEKMLKIYDNIKLPVDRREYMPLFQPVVVRPVLADYGIRMDGSMQMINGTAVFPQEFFMPQDIILYKEYKRTENTYCVHYDNCGWSYGTDNKHEKKVRDNNLLWNLLTAQKEEN